jgi:hypothetical protein
MFVPIEQLKISVSDAKHNYINKVSAVATVLVTVQFSPQGLVKAGKLIVLISCRKGHHPSHSAEVFASQRNGNAVFKVPIFVLSKLYTPRMFNQLHVFEPDEDHIVPLLQRNFQKLF